jgi:hypothetical protein
VKTFRPDHRGWRLYEPLARKLPRPIAGLVDGLVPGIGYGYGACNGQRGRAAMLRELVDLVDPTAIVETGTFRGMTTRFLAQLTSRPIYSVEVDTRYYIYSVLRLARLRRVHIHRGDSRDFLRWLAGTDSAGNRPIFYLDAHCQLAGTVALAGEVAIIDDCWRDAAVVIDDAQVSDDPGYGYDTYNGRPIGLDSLALPDGRFDAFWPALESSDETGYRRGAVVLATRGDVAMRLWQARTLRPAAA